MERQRLIRRIAPLGLGVVALMLVMAGCTTPPPEMPEPPPGVGGPVFHSHPLDQLTISEKLVLVNQAAAAIKIDPRFSAEYRDKLKSIASHKRTLPLLALAPLKNNIPGDNDNGMRELAVEFQNQLRKSGLFDVVDDLLTPELFNRLLATNLGENENGVQPIGSFDAPDLYLSGELCRAQDGNGYMFSFRLTMLDTATRKVFWSESVRITKRER